MNIKERVISDLSLKDRIDVAVECYQVKPKRYVVFWEKTIDKNTIYSTLDSINDYTNNDLFSNWKTIIVLGKTKEVFKKEELFFFNSISTFIVFYLFDEIRKVYYSNSSWIFALGCNYKSIVKKIRKSIEKVSL